MKLKKDWSKTIVHIRANPHTLCNLESCSSRNLDLDPLVIEHNRKTFGRSIPLTLENLFFEIEECDFDSLVSLASKCAKSGKEKILESIHDFRSESYALVDKREEPLCPVSLVKQICSEIRSEYKTKSSALYAKGVQEVIIYEQSLLLKYSILSDLMLDRVRDFWWGCRTFQKSSDILGQIDHSLICEYLGLIDEGQVDLGQLRLMSARKIPDPRQHLVFCR